MHPVCSHALQVDNTCVYRHAQLYTRKIALASYKVHA